MPASHRFRSDHALLQPNINGNKTIIKFFYLTSLREQGSTNTKVADELIAFFSVYSGQERERHLGVIVLQTKF